MTDRLPVHALDPTGATDGQVPTYDAATGRVIWADGSTTGGVQSIVAGTGVTVDNTDPANPIVSATGSTDPEVVRDTMAAALVAGSNVTITPDDAANTITIAATTSGGGGTADPRLLYRDDCAASALPTGATASGVTFDATELRRVLAGPATYTSATCPLRGTVVAVAAVTHLSNLTAGDLHFQIMKGTSRVCRVSIQGDGNIVAYNSSGSPMGNTATSTSTSVADGQSVRLALTVNTNGQCSVTVSNLGGGSNTPNTNGQQSWGIHTHRWASGLAGLAAGDSLTAQLVQEKPGSTTRTVALSRMLVSNGAVLLG